MGEKIGIESVALLNSSDTSGQPNKSIKTGVTFVEQLQDDYVELEEVCFWDNKCSGIKKSKRLKF